MNVQRGALQPLLLCWGRAWAVALPLLLAGCASTTTAVLTPSAQAPVCAGIAKALVLWTTDWRADQKDVPEREAAAADGIQQFFQQSGCFAATTVQRVSLNDRVAAVAANRASDEKVVVIVVRELGPTLALGGSAALIEGATEVALDISEFAVARTTPRTFSVQWRNGGAGVIKGVASLPQDLQAALAAGLQPVAR